MRKISAVLAVCAAFAVQPRVAGAADLVIGTKFVPGSLDPHYFNSAENENPSAHVYEKLVDVSPDGAVIPALATSWKNIDPLTWEFKLRPGVTFHNGDALSVDDIAFSIDRIKTIKGTPGGFLVYVSNIKSVEAAGDGVLIKTTNPNPLLLSDLARVAIVQKKAIQNASVEDFNMGRVNVGTGPYKLTEYTVGTRLVFTRNDSYWGGSQPWDKVIVRFISNDAARVAALLAGDIDLADSIPSADAKRLGANPAVKVSQRAGSRVQYYGLDIDRAVSPFAKGPNGENPLRNVKVRKAISMAINRRAIVDVALEGAGVATSEMFNPELLGYSRPPIVTPFDPEGAKKLLAEVGYADGFDLTIHSGNDRYPGADRIVQATAQFLTRIGIRVKVAMSPNNIFFPAATKRDYSFFFLGYGTVDGSNYIKTVLHSQDEGGNYGSSNRGGYKNPVVDKLVEAGLVEFDEKKRLDAFREAAQIFEVEDQGIISLYYPSYIFAYKANKLTYTITLNGLMQAIYAKPVSAK